MTATARALEDHEEFATTIENFVAADPMRSTVLATVFADVLAGVRSYPGSSWLVAEADNEVIGIAMHTPPHRLWLSAMPDAAAEAIAAVMADRAAPGALPGISGSREAASAAARAWQVLRPDETLTEVRALRSYTLGQLQPPSDVPAEEVDLVMPDVQATTAARLAGRGAFHVWEDGGTVVSLAGHSAQVSGMVRVGPVYTPPEHRRRGYGGAVTAATSRHALDNGASEVTLFTDLANPTSNAIYQQLGYLPVGDFVELDLA